MRTITEETAKKKIKRAKSKSGKGRPTKAMYERIARDVKANRIVFLDKKDIRKMTEGPKNRGSSSRKRTRTDVCTWIHAAMRSRKLSVVTRSTSDGGLIVSKKKI